MHFQYNDGGRKAAGYQGDTGDCVTRAIAIAAELPYQQVYEEIFQRKKSIRVPRKAAKTHHKSRSPRLGCWRKAYEPYLLSLGFEWTPTMQIGQGCTVHLRADELPKGRLVVAVSRHLTTMIDGVIVDTYDCSREGTRCVYGYYRKIENS